MCAARCSKNLIVCVLLNAQYAHTATMLNMFIVCVLLNAQYVHCMCAAQCSICSFYMCCSIFNMLIVCVLLNAQYAHVCKTLNALYAYWMCAC